MAQIPNFVRYTLRFLIFFCSNVYTLPIFLTWNILIAPLRFIIPALYWRLEAFLFGIIQGMIVTWLNGYPVFECGDDIGLLHDQEALMLINHQSTGDTPILMLANYNKGKAPCHTLWIMWYIFKYTNFGLVSLTREDFFIHSGRGVRNSEMDRLKKFMKTSYLEYGRKWVIVFPEGGFLRKRREASHAFAKKNNLPILNNVTLPRIGAVEAVLSTVGEPQKPQAEPPSKDATGEPTQGESELPASNGVDHQLLRGDPKKPLKWVIDVTLAYKDGEPLDMLGMCIGYCPKKRITMHYRAYRVQDIPRDTEGLTKWLYDRYTEKEKILEDFYKTGKISPEVLAERRILKPLAPSVIRFDLIENILIHMFCVGSFYLHCVFIYKPMWTLLSAVLGYVI